MTVITQEYASLSELAKDERVDLNKSKLTFYARLGLIVPVNIVGRMQIYNVDEVLNCLKVIETYQKRGLTIEEIKGKMK